MWYHVRYHVYDIMGSELWYHSSEPMISYWYDFIDLLLWNHTYNITYEIIYMWLRYHRSEYKIIAISRSSQHISQTGTKICTVIVHVSTDCHLKPCRMSLRKDPLSTRAGGRLSLRSAAAAAGLWPACCLALSQHTVAAHSGTARMPLCFITNQTWRPGWARVRRGRVRWL